MPGLNDFLFGKAVSLSAPDWLRLRRGAAAESLRTTAFPSAEEEVWRYSPLQEINLEDFSLAGGQANQGAETADALGVETISRGRAGGELEAQLLGPHEESAHNRATSRAGGELEAQLLGGFGEAAALVVFRNGALLRCWISAEAAEAGLLVAPLSYDASAARSPQTPGADASLSSDDPGLGDVQSEASGEPPDFFVLLNDVFSAAPVHVFVPRGVRLERPILVVHILDAAGGVAVFPRLLLTLGEGADAQVVDAAYSLSSQFSAGESPVSSFGESPGSSFGESSVVSFGESSVVSFGESSVVSFGESPAASSSETTPAPVPEAPSALASRSVPRASLFVPVVEISVDAGARLGYLSVQKLDRRTTAVANTSAVVGNQAHLNMGIVAVGGGYARARVDSCLTGRGATGDMSAMYFADGCQVHDFRVLQNHNAPDTNSNLLFVGAVDDEARSIYSGLIRVANGARGTDAVQTNRILKLSEGVWAESVPNLEIENDDVKCAHSTSVGPIDEAQRFYLESRGVPPDLAERLIVEGYFGEVAARLPVPALSEAMNSLVSAKLRPHAAAQSPI